MGRRFVVERMENAGVHFTRMWVHPHIGRYCKRKLSKARRRAWKEKYNIKPNSNDKSNI